jgi:hypothetical protein
MSQTADDGVKSNPACPGRRRGHYPRRPDPTPDQIRRECERIRAGWTDADYRARAGVTPIDWPVTPPTVRVRDIGADTIDLGGAADAV